MTTNVLFVCSGNSCRSQMAEGWLREEKILAIFRASRDDIRWRITDLITRLNP